MNKIIVKLMVALLVCMASVLLAQDAPPAAPPPGAPADTAQDAFKKSFAELEQLMKDFDEKYGSKPADGPVVKVGDKKDGGIVYWVDATGKHGLVVWPNDLGIKKWEESDQACKKLGAGWRLPTKDELDKLYKANMSLQILASYFFFQSSTEESPGVVWKQSLSNGALKTSYKTGAASTAAVKGF